MNRYTLYMCAILVMVAAGVSAQDRQIRRCVDTSLSCVLWNVCNHGCRRRAPLDPSAYYVPRSVGINCQIPDMSTNPILWWQPGQPLADTMEEMAAHGFTAVGLMLRAHPTEPYFENVRKAFRNPDIDVLVIRPEHWGSTDYGCDDKYGLAWENTPPEIFEDLYHYYAGQQKHIFITTNESDWQLHGVGCKARDECPDTPRFHRYLEWCNEGSLVPYLDYSADVSCEQIACDMVKQDRAEYLLRIYNELQAAAVAARAAHPDSPLRVWFAPEVNFYETEPWQFLTVSADVIPRMDIPPDFIGIGLWKKAGDPVEALHYVMDHTGLPAYRIFISEVGAFENYDGQQYERISEVVPKLFDQGVAFALVWSWENEFSYITGRSVIDPETGEHRSGMTAIEELNSIYR